MPIIGVGENIIKYFAPISVIHPASTTHSQLSEDELLDQGIKPNTIRLSIGTEHIDDILADLEKVFAKVVYENLKELKVTRR